MSVVVINSTPGVECDIVRLPAEGACAEFLYTHKRRKHDPKMIEEIVRAGEVLSETSDWAIGYTLNINFAAHGISFNDDGGIARLFQFKAILLSVFFPKIDVLNDRSINIHENQVVLYDRFNLPVYAEYSIHKALRLTHKERVLLSA